MDPVATLSNAHKRFGSTHALRGVDLELQRGEVLTVLGPNGAGKTTAISLLLGLRKPSEGTARLFGGDPRDPSTHHRIGATPQETGFPERLRVLEVVNLVRAHYADPVPAAELLKRFGLSGLEKRQTGGLSGGQKRRLAVALAFAGRPEAVVLDEPTTGLDVEARRSLWEALRTYVKTGGTVLLTTHYLEEAEALADRVVVIDRGRATASGSVEDIKARVGLQKVRFRADALPDLPNVAQSDSRNGTFTVYTSDSDTLVRALVEEGHAFSQLEVLPATLEEAFLVLTGDASA